MNSNPIREVQTAISSSNVSDAAFDQILSLLYTTGMIKSDEEVFDIKLAIPIDSIPMTIKFRKREGEVKFTKHT